MRVTQQISVQVYGIDGIMFTLPKVLGYRTPIHVGICLIETLFQSVFCISEHLPLGDGN